MISFWLQLRLVYTVLHYTSGAPDVLFCILLFFVRPGPGSSEQQKCSYWEQRHTIEFSIGGKRNQIHHHDYGNGWKRFIINWHWIVCVLTCVPQVFSCYLYGVWKYSCYRNVSYVNMISLHKNRFYIHWK